MVRLLRFTQFKTEVERVTMDEKKEHYDGRKHQLGLIFFLVGGKQSCNEVK